MENRTLGRYRIDSLIGEGGMGRVYKAYDDSLGRPAAVKVLPQEVMADAGRVERFVREARSASSLNHPNVVTIYEVGTHDNGEGPVHFMAMEFVDGHTLRERLVRGRLDVPEAVEVAAQIADGLTAAHAAGIVHRDLKPENIVLARSGFAKILDFGLAKLRDEESPAGTEDIKTAVMTRPGTLLGSIGYMSPEQARGETADHRSDIFSLGCILYESVSGTRPFHGESNVDTLHKIIHDDPPPLPPSVPAELQRIIRKTLAKNREHRYQSVRDLALDLHELKRELESPARVSAAPVAEPPSRGMWIAIAIGVLVLLGAATGLMLIRRNAVQTTATPATPMSITRLTSNGNVVGAVISPDGQYFAYAYSDAGQHSLWIREIATGTALELVPPFRGGMWGMSFAPDSRSIYYAEKSPDDPSGILFRTSILGGEQKKLLSGIDSHVNFAPDGKRMLFLRNHTPQAGHSALVIANADGSDQKVLLSKAPPQNLLLFWGAPAWSPDGRTIAMPMRDGTRWSLLLVDVATGKERPLTNTQWSNLGDVKWMRDGSGVLLIGQSEGQQLRQLWFVGMNGERRPITNDLFDYRIVSMTSDGSRVITVAADSESSLWLVPLSDANGQRKLTTGKYDGLRGLAAATDGTVFFSSIENDRWDISALSPDGKRRQVTSGEWASLGVALSPDQRYLVTGMPRQKDWILARLDRDGSNLKALCPVVTSATRRGQTNASFTPDSKAAIFDSGFDGVQGLWKVSIDGGTPVRLRDGYGPSVSPDGSLVAFLTPTTVEVAPLQGSGPVRSFKKVTVTTSSMVEWSPDGKGILHNAGVNDRANVWLQPLDGSDPRKVTHFDDEIVHSFDVLGDGKSLIVARGRLSRDAVMITNLK